MSRRLAVAACAALVVIGSPGAAGAAGAEPDPASPEAVFGPAAEAPENPGPAASAPPAAPPGRAEARTGGLIPYVLIGPKVAATILFPPNVMVGAELKVAGWVGASFETAVFPKDRSAGSSGYGGTIQSWSAGLRVFPFRGSFFLGAVAGAYDVAVTQTQSAGPGGASAVDALSVKGSYLGPQLGWKWVSDVGLFAGLNLGYGFSLSYSSQLVSASTPGSQTDLEKAKQKVDEILKSGVPALTLLELGWVF